MSIEWNLQSLQFGFAYILKYDFFRYVYIKNKTFWYIYFLFYTYTFYAFLLKLRTLDNILKFVICILLLIGGLKVVYYNHKMLKFYFTY